jgi:hypothetical protein
MTNEEKRKVVEQLYIIWMQMPQLRLGQLLSWASGRKDIFYIEDFDLIEAARVAISKQT